MSKPAIRNLVVISDLHAGCRIGLHPAHKTKLDDGGFYEPSAFQRVIWGYWKEFWGRWVPLVTKDEPFGVLLNGDAIDGAHHGSKTQVSQNHADQANIAAAILEPVVEACQGKFWWVRGTEAHVGKSAEDEERLAQRLGAVPNKDGQYARWDLWKHVGDALVHATHHVGGTSSAAYETSAIHRTLHNAFNEAGRWREQPPQVVVRGHVHRYVKTEISSAAGPAYGVICPAWQGRTPFSHRIQTLSPQFGGILIRAVKSSTPVTDTGEDAVKVVSRVWRIGRSEAE